jgi:hypothetical protein
MRANVEPGPEGSLYGDRSNALQELDKLLAGLSTRNMKRVLAPTGNLQELSIECGWGDEFNELSAALETVLGMA